MLAAGEGICFPFVATHLAGPGALWLQAVCAALPLDAIVLLTIYVQSQEKKQKLSSITTTRSEALCTQKGIMGPTADVDPMGH